MPVITVVASGGDATAAANRNLLTLLGANAPLTGWVKNLTFQNPDNGTNTEAAGGIKIGKSGMTSTNYDAFLLLGDSADDTDDRIMLRTRYVRTDEAGNQSLIVNFDPT